MMIMPHGGHRGLGNARKVQFSLVSFAILLGVAQTDATQTTSVAVQRGEWETLYARGVCPPP